MNLKSIGICVVGNFDLAPPGLEVMRFLADICKKKIAEYGIPVRSKVLNWMELIFRDTGEPHFRPCPLLRKLVRAGHYGARVDKGFFTYDAERNRLDRPPDDTPRLA